MKAKKRAWVMPKWMERYRPYFTNTGGNSIEDLMNGDASPEINLPLFVIQACVQSQVALLSSMRTHGELGELP